MILSTIQLILLEVRYVLSIFSYSNCLLAPANLVVQPPHALTDFLLYSICRHLRPQLTLIDLDQRPLEHFQIRNSYFVQNALHTNNLAFCHILHSGCKQFHTEKTNTLAQNYSMTKLTLKRETSAFSFLGLIYSYLEISNIIVHRNTQDCTLSHLDTEKWL